MELTNRGAMDEEAQLRKFTLTPGRDSARHGGLTIRIPKVYARDLLYDWNAWKQLLSRTDLDNWLLGSLRDANVAEVQVLVDNGLGADGVCPYHHTQHFQIYPLNSEPMRCAEAVKLQEPMS